jgi:Cd2+/Zn2+-exporting ATPase
MMSDRATSKLHLEIPVLLTDAADQCARCVEHLVATLRGRPGVLDVHVVREAGASTGELCIHYDPEQLSLSRIEELALAAGAQISARYAHRTWRVAGVRHAHAARRLARRLNAEPGVLHADVSAAGVATVEFDRDRVTEIALVTDLAKAGVGVLGEAAAGLPEPAAPEAAAAAEAVAHAHGVLGERAELWFALAAGGTLALGWALDGHVAVLLSRAIYSAAYVLGGFFTLREAWENVRSRRFEIDTLMLVAAIGAAALGAWAEGGLLLFLFSLGHALEHFAMGRARHAIEALAQLAPERATVRRGETMTTVPLEALRLGDRVVVRPYERLPADGIVAAGESAVNEAPITGESAPLDKGPLADAEDAVGGFAKVSAAHRVFAGTINGAGALEVIVARLAGETTLARVVKMVAEAQAQRSPTQRFTDRFEAVFVPSVLVVVGALMLAWLVIDEPFSASFYRAMAVLVAASPCALAISVPSAVLSGIARAARGGVLIKGGAALENLGTVSAIAFDKTGTLTEGKPRLTDVVPADGVPEEELLAVAMAVETRSDHPLAAAVVRDGAGRLGGRPTPAAEEVTAVTGNGVMGMVGGLTVQIAKPRFFDALETERPPEALQAEAQRLEEAGRTVMMVRHGARFLGVLGLMDTPRESARAVVDRLRALGIRRVIMLSGDNQSVADNVAQALGLDEARGGLMPEDKVEALRSLKRSDGRVAMVGDGVNDAPAMANATIGIAMGAAGSDVALEAADVALMADDLNHLPFAVGLSRRSSATVRQNLWMSLGAVALLVPATLFGLRIGAAVVFHEGSTVLVVLNALRLLAYEEPRRPTP